MATKKNQRNLVLLEQSYLAQNMKATKSAIIQFVIELEIEDKESDEYPEMVIVNFYTRAAFILQSFFVSKRTQFTLQEFKRLLPFSNRIGYIFFLSGLRGTNQALLLLRQRNLHEGQLDFTRTGELLKYLLLINPTSKIGTKDLVSLSERFPVLVAPLVINFLNFGVYGNALVRQRQEEIIQYFVEMPFPSEASPDYINMHLLWAVSSYHGSKFNVAVKNKINEIILQDLRTRGLQVEVLPTTYMLDVGKRKPQLLILAEHMHIDHVMNKCFGGPLSALSVYFDVEAYTAAPDMGRSGWQWVNRLHTFDLRDFNPKKEIDRIARLQPDVIIYPSIGMKNWTLTLSRLRLAPLQIALLGHPDFSYSASIDFTIGGGVLLENYKDDPKVIALQKSSGSLFQDVSVPVTSRQKTTTSTPLRLLVIANRFKLNFPFLEVLREIISNSTTKPELHFLNNLHGLHFQLQKAQIHDALGSRNVKVHPGLSTSEYYQILSTMDIMLSPFPFGGENSSLDCLLCGVPVLGLRGRDPQERLDYRVLHFAGLAGELVHESISGYKSKAIELLNNPKAIESLKRKINPPDIISRLKEEYDPGVTEFVDVVHDLYQKFAT